MARDKNLKHEGRGEKDLEPSIQGDVLSKALGTVRNAKVRTPPSQLQPALPLVQFPTTTQVHANAAISFKKPFFVLSV